MDRGTGGERADGAVRELEFEELSAAGPVGGEDQVPIVGGEGSLEEIRRVADGGGRR